MRPTARWITTAVALGATATTCVGCGSSTASSSPMAIVGSTEGNGTFIVSPTKGTGAQTVALPTPDTKDAFIELTCRSDAGDKSRATARLAQLTDHPAVTVVCGDNTSNTTGSSSVDLPIGGSPGPLTVTTSDPHVTWMVAIERARTH